MCETFSKPGRGARFGGLQRESGLCGRRRNPHPGMSVLRSARESSGWHLGEPPHVCHGQLVQVSIKRGTCPGMIVSANKMERGKAMGSDLESV